MSDAGEICSFTAIKIAVSPASLVFQKKDFQTSLAVNIGHA